jgi:hypothetical protein
MYGVPQGAEYDASPSALRTHPRIGAMTAAAMVISGFQW